MKIFITGGNGFLGRHLCSYLIGQGHDVVFPTSKECNLTNPDSLNYLPSQTYDQIYHLAAWTQAGDFCLHHSGEQWIINQQVNTNVLAWWHGQQPQAKLIALGTSVSYGTEDALSEERYMQDLPNEKFFAYAMSKRMLYAGLLSFSKQFGSKYLYLVPSTLYGPGYHMDGRQMHFIFDLIRKIMRGKLYDESVVLWGDGYQRRELVYVDDFVRIMVHLAPICENDLVNVGAGEEYTIRDFAQLICNQINFDMNAIQFDTGRYVGARSKCLSTTKLQRLMPNLSLTPLSKGLSQTIDWFWENRAALLPLPSDRDSQ
jgi:GDP-L-fucose synthase